MNSLRYGKIGRLPKLIRDQLNHRLEDNEPTKPTLAWLNHQPEVQAILKAQFDAKPITEQNLSAWRQGGFQDWLQQEQASDLLQHFRENTEALAQVAGEKPLTDHLASFLEVELVRLSQLLPEESDPDKRLDRVCQILKELRHLRHHDHQTIRLRHEQEIWQHEKAKLAAEDQIRQQAEQRSRARDPLFARLQADSLVQLLGNTPAGRKFANELAETQHDLPPGSLDSSFPTPLSTTPPPPPPTHGSPSPAHPPISTVHDIICAAQNSAVSINQQPPSASVPPLRCLPPVTTPPSPLPTPHPAESNPIQPDPTPSASINPQPPVPSPQCLPPVTTPPSPSPTPHPAESNPIQPDPSPSTLNPPRISFEPKT